MTTTKEALDIVNQLKAQADAEIVSYQKVADGHQIIIDRLNGVIQTPAADYVAIQKQLDDEKTAHEETKSQLATITQDKENLAMQVETLTQQNTNLQTQVRVIETPVETTKKVPMEMI